MVAGSIPAEGATFKDSNHVADHGSNLSLQTHVVIPIVVTGEILKLAPGFLVFRPLSAGEWAGLTEGGKHVRAQA